jgi:hypothetical protein
LIDITADLTEGLIVRDEQGNQGMIEVKYRDLPQRCFICRKDGHLPRLCPYQENRPMEVEVQMQDIKLEGIQEEVKPPNKEVQQAVTLNTITAQGNTTQHATEQGGLDVQMAEQIEVCSEVPGQVNPVRIQLQLQAPRSENRRNAEDMEKECNNLEQQGKEGDRDQNLAKKADNLIRAGKNIQEAGKPMNEDEEDHNMEQEEDYEEILGVMIQQELSEADIAEEQAIREAMILTFDKAVKDADAEEPSAKEVAIAEGKLRQTNLDSHCQFFLPPENEMDLVKRQEDWVRGRRHIGFADNQSCQDKVLEGVSVGLHFSHNQKFRTKKDFHGCSTGKCVRHKLSVPRYRSQRSGLPGGT